ncbi:MAG: hypothetical protein WCJ30_01180 [Deltaproteobacteria bacterium]
MFLLLVTAVGALASACGAANPFRLDDQVALFTDDVRWGRMPAAETQLSPALRATFARRHAAWGRALNVMDVEVDATRVSGLVGTVRTRYVWMRRNDMETRETIVESHWRATPLNSSWVCEDESIVSGDPGLLVAIR